MISLFFLLSFIYYFWSVSNKILLVRNIVDAMDQDYDIATKYKDILSENKFQMVECKKRTIHYGNL
jgi:hypothetical protein